MEVRLAGTGGGDGWPEPDCRCASCERARIAGHHRAAAQVIVDGVLRIGYDGPSARAGYRVERVPGGWDVTGRDGTRLLAGECRGVTAASRGGGPDTTGPDTTGPDTTGPDTTGPDTTGPDTTGAYDIVLLDLLENPAQLGALRRRGLVREGTVVAVLHADHRVSSEAELARRCGYWGVSVPRDGDVLTASPGVASPATPGAKGAQGDPAALAVPAPPAARRVLVLGGARSGKSRHAELRLAAEPRVTYLAAGPYPPGAQPAPDTGWAERVAAHRARRPAWWQTVESVDAAAVLRSESGVVLFDGAGTWLAAVLDATGAWADDDAEASQSRIGAKVDELLEAWRQTRGRVVAVSDEVGSSIHPPTRAGRLFRDQLGWLNQRLAAEADESVLMVAGRALTLPA